MTDLISQLTTSFPDNVTGAITPAALRSYLTTLIQQQASARFVATGVNFNSTNTDNAIAIQIPSGYTRYMVDHCYICNAGANLSTAPATFGVFTSTGGGGSTIVTSTGVTVSSTAADAANNMQSFNPSTMALTDATLYARVGTAAGSTGSATGDVVLNVRWLT